jgi:hypothetical protein
MVESTVIRRDFTWCPATVVTGLAVSVDACLPADAGNPEDTQIANAQHVNRDNRIKMPLRRRVVRRT